MSKKYIEVELRPGMYLYSSCRGEDYGMIINVGTDFNGNDTIDIEVYPDAHQGLIDCEDEWHGKQNSTSIEIPNGLNPILRNVLWVTRTDARDEHQYIECNTPGSGCYRCDKLFSIRLFRSEFKK